MDKIKTYKPCMVMEYRLKDTERFQNLLKTTAPLANANNGKRIIVNTDAYEIYNQFRINPKNMHHTFNFGLV